MIKIKVVNKGHQQLPRYATPMSAGMDLRANLDEPITLLPMLAIKGDDPRLNVNTRIVSTIFATLLLLVNFITVFNPPEKSFTIYFIIVGLIILIFIGVIYSLVKASNDSD